MSRNKELLSIGGTLISGIADLKSIFEKADTWIVILCSLAFLIFLGIFLFLKFRDRFDFINRSLDSTDVSSDEYDKFKNLNTHLIIDIEENFKDAKLTLRRRVLCMQSGTATYKYLFSPHSKISNFIPNIGYVTVEEIEGAADIKLTLDGTYNKGDEIDLELKMDVKDLFENTKSFWLLSKAYQGKEITKIEVRLPKDSNVSSFIGDIIVDLNKRERKPLKKQPRKDLHDGRIILIAETAPFEFKVGQKIAVNWKYLN